MSIYTLLVNLIRWLKKKEWRCPCDVANVWGFIKEFLKETNLELNLERVLEEEEMICVKKQQAKWHAIVKRQQLKAILRSLILFHHYCNMESSRSSHWNVGIHIKCKMPSYIGSNLAGNLECL